MATTQKLVGSSEKPSETPEGMHENAPLPSASVPNYPPSVLMLKGTVGDYSVSVPGWSYTVMRTVADMYVKAGQKLKRPVDITLYDTGGRSWNENEWTSLLRFRSDPRTK